MKNKDLEIYKKVVVEHLNLSLLAEDRQKQLAELNETDHPGLKAARKEADQWFQVVHGLVQGQSRLIQLIEADLTFKQREEIRKFVRDNFGKIFEEPVEAPADPSVT